MSENSDMMSHFKTWRRQYFLRSPTRLLNHALDDDLIPFARILIEQGQGVNRLPYEIRNGNTKRALNLIAAGAEFYTEGNRLGEPDPPLQEACIKNNLHVGKALLEAGYSVNYAGVAGYTALMSAAIYGRKEFVDLLMQHNADPTIRRKGMTAYDHAENKGWSFTQLLADYECAWKAENSKARSPLLLPSPKKIEPAPVPANDGWSCTGDVVIRTVLDELSGTRMKNIFDFVAGQMITEISSNGDAPQMLMTPLESVKAEFRAEAEKRRNAKPQTPGLI